MGSGANTSGPSAARDRIVAVLAASRVRFGTGWGVLAGIVASSAVAVVHFYTSPDTVFLMPLALAVAAVAWFSTTRAWAFTVVFGSALWSLADLAGRASASVPIEIVALLVRMTVLGILGFFAHELRRAITRERELAVRDSLTGLLNRRGFFEIAERELARARRDGLPVTLIELDMDDFKRVNDTRGHHTGDRVLSDFAQRVGARLRATDVFGRMGGDEFMILLLADEPEAAHVVTAIQGLPGDASLPSVACSIGSVTYTKAPASLEAAMREADSRMYADKGRRIAGRRSGREGTPELHA